MKFANVISIILLFVYSMLTFLGIAIYHCSCTHSQGLVVMAIQTGCPPCSSSAENCCSHNGHHHDEDNDCEEGDCCSLDYQYLKIDQLKVDQFHNSHLKVFSLLFSPFLSVDDFTIGIKDDFAAIKNHSPPSGLLKIPLIYMYAQLRL